MSPFLRLKIKKVRGTKNRELKHLLPLWNVREWLDSQVLRWRDTKAGLLSCIKLYFSTEALSPSLSFSLPLSLSISLSLSLPVYLSLCLALPPPLSLCLSIYLSIYPSLSLSLSPLSFSLLSLLFLCLSVSLSPFSLSLFLSLSLSLSSLSLSFSLASLSLLCLSSLRLINKSKTYPRNDQRSKPSPETVSCLCRHGDFDLQHTRNRLASSYWRSVGCRCLKQLSLNDHTQGPLLLCFPFFFCAMVATFLFEKFPNCLQITGPNCLCCLGSKCWRNGHASFSTCC